MSVEGHLRARLRQVEEDARKVMAQRDSLLGQVTTLRAKLDEAEREIEEMRSANEREEFTA